MKHHLLFQSSIRRILWIVCLCGIFTGISIAQSSVSVTVNTQSPGNLVPDDYLGFSFGSATLNYNINGTNGYFFSAANTQGIFLFNTLGIKNLRIASGERYWTNDGSLPLRADVDSLFSFVDKVTDLKVIYSLPLFNADGSANASAAKYVWDNYSNYIDCFELGNEPDWHSMHTYPGHTVDPDIYETTPGTPGTAYPSYDSKWNVIAGDILDSVSSAQFAGTSTGSNYPVSGAANTYYNGKSWTVNFANDEKNSGIVSLITLHNYVGQSATGLTPQQMVNAMLSSSWVTSNYPALYNGTCAQLISNNQPYRLEESNSYSGSVDGGSNCYATALFMLDYLHWWAAHGAAGVNTHNKEWTFNAPISYISGNYGVYPEAYGFKAFDLGGHGYLEPTSITSNPGGLNITAYGVGNSRDLYVTIINKEHGGSPRTAVVTINPSGYQAVSASSIVLAGGANGGISLTATLGGATISNSAQQFGTWNQLPLDANGHPQVTVPGVTAVVVHVREAGNFAGPIEMNQNGALEMFSIGNNNQVYRIQQKNGNTNSGYSNWNNWIDMGGGLSASEGPTVVRNLDNTIAIFVAATSPKSDVYYNHQVQPGSGFKGWEDLGGSGISSLRAGINPDGSLSVFGLDANGNLYHNSQTSPGGSWTGWSQITGKTIQPGFVVAPNKDGRLVVLGVETGSNHHVFNVWQATPNGKFGSWTDMGNLGGTNTNPLLRVARNLDGRLEVFGIGNNQHVWHDWQPTSGGGWNGWVDLGTKSIQPGFVIAQHKDGRLVLLGIDANSPYHCFNLWQPSPPNGTWGSWTDMGLPSGATLNGRLMVASTADHRLQVFGLGSDGHVYSDWQPTSGGGWVGWNASGSDFGGGWLGWPAQKIKAENSKSSNGLPTEFKLIGNYPNPFNPTTIIIYTVPETGAVTLSVYNVLGQEVRSVYLGIQSRGIQKTTFNSSNLSSGVYFYKLEMTNKGDKTIRMIFGKMVLSK